MNIHQTCLSLFYISLLLLTVLMIVEYHLPSVPLSKSMYSPDFPQILPQYLMPAESAQISLFTVAILLAY